MTVHQRIQLRNRMNEREGNAPGWAEEALDFYLDGSFSASEISECFGVSKHTLYNAIAKTALFRLMVQRNADLMTDMEELTDGDTVLNSGFTRSD